MDNRQKLISKIESIDKDISPDEKKKLVIKIAKIIEEPNFVIIDEIENMSSKLEDISGIISSINSKEVTEYGNELSTLIESLDLIKQSIIDKETVINIPLDELSSSINKVEKAIKEIKEVKIPEFPTSISVDNSFDIEIIRAIKEIPEFPVKELAKLVSGIEDKISNIKLEVPEFDYARIEKKLSDIVAAVKKINLTVYGGGNSMVGVKNTTGTQVNPATSDIQTDGTQRGAFNLLDENGVPYGVKHIMNKPRVSSTPYLYDIAEGVVPGHYSILKFGTRTAIAANTQSTIWEGTNAIYTYLTSAEQLKVSSSSANDTVAGSGVRTFTLIGLDANWNEITETVNMNGVTPVTTTLSFIRIFRAFGATNGTIGGSNLGNITVTNNAGTIQLIYIPINDGQTLMTLWSVPAGKTAYITQLTTSNDSGKGARFSLFTRLNNGVAIYPWQIKYRGYTVGGTQVIPFNIPFKIPAMTDIEVRFTTPSAAGTTSGGATFELWYE